MSDPTQPRNSSFLKRPSYNQTNGITTKKFLPSYIPEEKYKFENFEILTDKKIGTGFLSNVYIANNKIDNLQYAVKIINKKNVLSNGLSLDIIQNEIEIQERILHPNIVRMYSHFEDKTNYYCFLEYINGPTLLNIMQKKEKGLSERETCKYFSQITESIKFLHSNKIIHRDIKLENFLLKNNSIIKLIDFGCCALLTDEEPKRLSTCGTHLYMSPELINSQPYDYCVDIWALGVLFFELLHGYSPFGKRDDDYNIIYSNILLNKIKSNVELTNNCLDLLRKMLESDPDKRINIYDVINHNWMKDWNIDNSINNNNDDSVKKIIGSNIDGIKGDDDNFFDNVLSKVEKKNKRGGKKKRKGASVAQGVNYKKRKYENSSFKSINENKDNKTNDEDENDKIEQLLNIKRVEIPKEEKIIEKPIEKKIKNSPRNEKIKTQEKKIEKPIIIKKENIQNSNNNKNEEITSFSSKKDYSEIQHKQIKNDSNDDELTAENLLNMLDNSKNKSNNKSNSSNSDEIKTNLSHLKRKKEKQNRIINNSNNDSFRNHTYKIITKIPKNEGNDLKDTLEMFAKAEKLKQENEKIKLKTKEKSFWDKLFAPFKCGED